MPSKSTDIVEEQKKFLENIALKAELQEGKDAVRLILREIYRKGTIGTKKLSRKLHIPVPTIAAVRKELEKEEIIDRTKRGAILTEKGILFLERQLGIHYTKDLICQTCDGTTIEMPIEFDEKIKELKKYTKLRPKPITKYDQAFAKPITALRRAYLLLQNDDLEGKEILLLGDDDFTSLAIAILNTTAKITVIDIDNRLLEIINSIATEKNLPITCHKLDLREPLPKELLNSFDTIFTDPPYTLPGLKLFLTRAIQLLKEEKNKKIYLAFVNKPSDEQLELQKVILDFSLTIRQILQGFNIYEGAEILGNITDLIVLSTTSETRMVKNEFFDGKIYTGEINPTVREYKCKNNHVVKVGLNQEIKTIEELKLNGCPICKDKTEFTRVNRYKINQE